MTKGTKAFRITVGVLLGLIIIIAGGLSAAGCIGLGEVLGYGSSITDQDGFVAIPTFLREAQGADAALDLTGEA